MSANIEEDGTVKQLDRRPEPDEHITADTVQDKVRLSKFLLQLFREVSALKRRWAPNRIDFRKTVSGSGASPQTVTVQHNFKAPVVWWIVKATKGTTTTVGLGTTAVMPLVVEQDDSTDTTLVLKFYYSAVVTIRVEESG